MKPLRVVSWVAVVTGLVVASAVAWQSRRDLAAERQSHAATRTAHEESIARLKADLAERDQIIDTSLANMEAQAAVLARNNDTIAERFGRLSVPLGIGETFDELILTDGKTITDTAIRRIALDGLAIDSSRGLHILPFHVVPEDIRIRAFAALAESRGRDIPTVAPAVAQSGASKPQWRQAFRANGTTTKTTEPFSLGPEWRMTWSARTSSVAEGSGYGGNFIANALRSDGGGQQIANVMTPGKDTTYGRGAGEYRIEVIAALMDWEVVVETR